MKSNVHSLLIIVFAVILLTSCSKEKKIKRHLTGSWTITQVVTVTTVNNGSPDTVTDNSETVTTFDKDGSGTASSSGSGSNPFPDDFTWSNTDEKLTIVDTKTPITIVYDVVEHSKKEMILNTVISGTSSGDPFTNDVTITMNAE
ncbi:MAG: lipocalin family protein [Flavobacteriales bacterium]|nr:lipocalin family protein [Flavobacteriales bacterium]